MSDRIVDTLTKRLAIKAGQGALAMMVLFIAYWPGGFAAVLMSRAFRGGEYAAVFVVLAAIFVLAMGYWRDRIYTWFAQSATAERMGIQ